MLRKLRILVAIVSLLAMVAVFLDFSGAAYRALSFLPKVQLVPALLSLNVLAIALVAVLTLVVGRLYCSVLCPLGIVQDVVARVRIWLTPRRRRRAGVYGHKAPWSRTRLAILLLFVVAAILALTGALAMSYAGLLEPYSIFGRAVGQWLVPLWRHYAVNVADAAAASGIWLFDREPHAGVFEWTLAAIAAAELIAVAVFAALRGRLYCNSVCPVGTALGAVSRHALLKVTIDEDKCVSCGLCARHCKAGCIDPKAHKIDYSRCVVCFDCLDHCHTQALSFRPAKAKKAAGAASDSGRRAFLTATGIIAGAAAAGAADKVTDGGFAPLRDKKSHDGIAPVPPGAVSMKNLRSHCTACQLCVSVCPNGVLKPSMNPATFMQPEMHFTEGFCRPECTACSNVCPAGAIKPIDIAEKSAVRIGTATVDAEACLSAAEGAACGACAAHCPTGAITMVDTPDGRLRPAVNAEACIGCGKCEYTCPAGTSDVFGRSRAAIYVKGLEQHIKF